MKISQIITEARSGSLYHALNANNFIHALKHDKLFATVVHYIQNDGSPTPMLDFYKYGYEDDMDIHEFIMNSLADGYLEEEEEEQFLSFLENTSPVVGISLTRSKWFAQIWAHLGVTIELDANLLSNNYQLKPIDFLSFDKKHTRSEAEEFLIISKKHSDFKKLKKNRYQPIADIALTNLDKYIVRIHIMNKLKDNEEFMAIINSKVQDKVTFF